MSNDPPAYEEAIKPGGSRTVPPPQPIPQQMAPPQVPAPMFIQQHPPQPVQQTVILQPGGNVAYVQNPNVILVHQIKVAPSFDPYPEFCPYCQCNVVTRRRFVGGSMMCMFLVLAIFFFPFIFFICCSSFKDAHHYCPRCSRLIAIRRR